MNKFKLGDKVRILDKTVGVFSLEDTNLKKGDTGIVRKYNRDDSGYFIFKNKDSDEDLWLFNESDLELYKRDLDHLEEGDILVNKDGDEYKVLGVHKYMVHLSGNNDFEAIGCGYTLEELKKCGFKLKDQQDETLEVTLDDIADKFNVNVKNLKVKKDK
jgi:hypothetical protein